MLTGYLIASDAKAGLALLRALPSATRASPAALPLLSLQGRNHALPIWKYTAVVPGLCATSMPACIPNLLASS